MTRETHARLRRALVWGVAIAALAFVVRAVPLRDRCPDPEHTTAPLVAVTRGASGCVLHRPGGDVTVPAVACDDARCEPGLGSTFARVRASSMAWIGLLYLVGTLAWAARWHRLLRLAGVPLSLARTWRVTLEAQAGGVLLPGGVGGDVLRVTSIVGLGAPASVVVASVLLDRALGLATLGGVAAALAAVFEPGRLDAATLGLGTLPFAFVLGLSLVRVPALRRARVLEHPRLASTVRPVLEFLGDPRAPRAILGASALSVLNSAAQLVIVRLLCSAVGSPPTVEHAAYTGTAFVFVVATVPGLPGGWGTADAAFVFFLGLAGVTSSGAAAVSLLYRLCWYAAAAVGAALYAARRGRAT